MTLKFSKRTFLRRASCLALSSALSANTRSVAHAQAQDAALEELSKDLTTHSWGQMLRPGQPEHAKIKYYNARFDCVSTKAYIRPANPEGLQKVIEWAKRHRRAFGIRGGGHSFEGKSSHPDLVIDMSHLTKLNFKADGALEVEAGVRLGEVYKVLGAVGRVLPAGTCPTVGIVGHTLGGGIGDFLPMFGFAAESLTAATLVTLGGAILKVSDEAIEVLGGAPLPTGALKGRDLMKALRGGGQGSFGVVTHMTFKTYDVRSAKLASFKLDGANDVSSQRAVAIIQSWQAWRDALPKPMRAVVSSKVNLSRSAGGCDFDIAGLIVIPATSSISLADVRKTLNPLFQTAEFKNKKYAPLPNATSAIKTFLDDDETTHNPKRKMLYGSSSSLPAALPASAVQFLIQNLKSDIFASFYTSGGNSNATAATSLHPSEYLIEWSTYSARPEPEAHRKIRALNSEVMKLAGFRDHAFPNYPDNAARDYFPNRAELDAVRRLLDPDELSASSLLAKGSPPSTSSQCR